MDFVSLVLGAFLGALLGYFFALFQKVRETSEKRKVLFQALKDELSSLYNHADQGFDPGSVYFRSPLQLAVPTLLLDGETLDYQSHGNLIKALLRFQAAVANYNAMVEIANLDQISASPTSEKVLFDITSGLHKVLLKARDEVLSLLPRGK